MLVGTRRPNSFACSRTAALRATEQATGRVPASRGANLHIWRWLLFGLVLTAVIVGVVYMTVATYITSQATRAVRSEIEGTPADLGLAYETVSFESADHIPLRGWYLPAGG